MNDLASIRTRYKIACERRDTAPAFSREWDAAWIEIEQLREVARHARIARVELERPDPVWPARLALSRVA
jgi:hypothetical protein